MQRLFVFLLLSAFFGIWGCATEPVVSTESTSYLPLAVNNSWTYYRTKFVRGSIADTDTLRVTVLSKRTFGSETNYLISRKSTYGIDSSWVMEKNGVILKWMSNEWIPEIDLASSRPKGKFLSVLSNTSSHQESYKELSDSSFILSGKSYPVKRLRQQSILFDSYDHEALRINFNLSFAAGVGPVEVAFIDDPTQCQSCSLISEFWTYKLIDFHITNEK